MTQPQIPLDEAVRLAMRRIQRARSQMLLTPGTNGGYPFIFWATAALHLKLKAVPGLGEMAGGYIATDGTSIIFDPYCYCDPAQRSETQIMSDVAHEVSHCVKGDLWRVGDRDK